MKTIRMPKELLAKWLAALRSGEYTQCAGHLEKDGAHCCLGVLQAVTGDVVEDDGLPSFFWLDGKEVAFKTSGGYPDRAPYLDPLGTSAAEANDDGLTFAELADAIEACAEGI